MAPFSHQRFFHVVDQEVVINVHLRFSQINLSFSDAMIQNSLAKERLS